MQVTKSLRKKNSIIGLGWNRQYEQGEKIRNDEGNLQLFSLNAPYGFEPYGTLRLVVYFQDFLDVGFCEVM
jgi:hypothetical protein